MASPELVMRTPADRGPHMCDPYWGMQIRTLFRYR